MSRGHQVEVGVDWENGLVLHEGDAEWHPWDEAVYGDRPDPHADDCPACDAPLSSCSPGNACCGDCMHGANWPDPVPTDGEGQ